MKPIGNGGGMHGATSLVNAVRDIRASEIEILKSTDNSSIKVRIFRKGGANCEARRRTQHGEWFTVFHFQHFEDR